MRARFLLLSLSVPVSLPAQAVRGVQDSFEDQAALRVVSDVCDKRVVVLGELPEHGEAHGFGVKARIVEELVNRCGFRTVLFEAGSYDFFGLERSIAASRTSEPARMDSLDLALARAMGGFWWTRELAPWRRWLVREAITGRVMLGGIDDQLSATAAYAKATLPDLVGGAVPHARADECRAAVARYFGQTYSPTLPYDDAERIRLAACARHASDSAKAIAPREPTAVMLHDLAAFFARERGMVNPGTADPGDPMPPDRDLAMSEHVAWWLERRSKNAKVIVWTATTHAARVSAVHPVMPMGVRTLGARLADQAGGGVATIGFSALGGQWSRAGRPSQPLAPLPPATSSPPRP